MKFVGLDLNTIFVVTFQFLITFEVVAGTVLRVVFLNLLFDTVAYIQLIFGVILLFVILAHTIQQRILKNIIPTNHSRILDVLSVILSNILKLRIYTNENRIIIFLLCLLAKLFFLFFPGWFEFIAKFLKLVVVFFEFLLLGQLSLFLKRNESTPLENDVGWYSKRLRLRNLGAELWRILRLRW